MWMADITSWVNDARWPRPAGVPHGSHASQSSDFSVFFFGVITEPGVATRKTATETARHLDDLVAMIPDRATLMIGGFFGVGSPHRLIQGLVAAGRKGLTIIANDTDYPGRGIGKLIEARLVNPLVASHIGANPETQRQMLAGELEVELVPQGMLAERIRAGAYGLGGDIDHDRPGDGHRTRRTHCPGRWQNLAVGKAARADFVVNAWQADYLGNLRTSSRRRTSTR